MVKTQKQQGFTIVELLIVIVVIGILAALVITTFTGIQKKARDTERQTDVKALHGQLEAYYAQNGRYPTLANVNDATWRGTNMKGLDREALKDPKNGATDGTEYNLASAAATNVYSYAVTNAGGTACDNTTGNECTQYTISADLENDTNNFTKSNLN